MGLWLFWCIDSHVFHSFWHSLVCQTQEVAMRGQCFYPNTAKNEHENCFSHYFRTSYIAILPK